MPDSCCAVQCTNMWGKCDEKIKFYRFSTMKTEQTTERRKKLITAMKKENWPKSEKQVDNARLFGEHFCDRCQIRWSSSYRLYPHSICFCPCGWCLEEEKKYWLIWKISKTCKKTGQKKKKEKKNSPNKNETAIYVNVEDEHSVPDCIEQIEFEIADKWTQTEEVIRHTLSKQKLRKVHLLKKQVKQKNAQIKELQHYKEKISSYENTRERDFQFLTGLANSQLFMWLLDVFKPNISL